MGDRGRKTLDSENPQVLHPENFFLLRGNHECVPGLQSGLCRLGAFAERRAEASINRIYGAELGGGRSLRPVTSPHRATWAKPGFFDECNRRYTVKLWKTFGDAFNWMPVGCRSVFGVNGAKSRLSDCTSDIGWIVVLS